jgi:hypothetical protein
MRASGGGLRPSLHSRQGAYFVEKKRLYSFGVDSRAPSPSFGWIVGDTYGALRVASPNTSVRVARDPPKASKTSRKPLLVRWISHGRKLRQSERSCPREMTRPASCRWLANERQQFVHAGRRRMRRAPVRADHLGAYLRRLEESPCGALSEFRAQRKSVGRLRVEMSNRLLQPGNNLGNHPNGLFRQVAVHVVPKPDLDAAVPEPANSYVDFAVVDLLKLDGEIGPGVIEGHSSDRSQTW